MSSCTAELGASGKDIARFALGAGDPRPTGILGQILRGTSVTDPGVMPRESCSLDSTPQRL